MLQVTEIITYNNLFFLCLLTGVFACDTGSGSAYLSCHATPDGMSRTLSPVSDAKRMSLILL